MWWICCGWCSVRIRRSAAHCNKSAAPAGSGSQSTWRVCCTYMSRLTAQLHVSFGLHYWKYDVKMGIYLCNTWSGLFDGSTGNARKPYLSLILATSSNKRPRDDPEFFYWAPPPGKHPRAQPEAAMRHLHLGVWTDNYHSCCREQQERMSILSILSVSSQTSSRN